MSMRVGRHRLLHAGVAAEARDLEVEAVLLEDAGARADVGRHERERLAAGLADAQRLGGGRRGDGASSAASRAEATASPAQSPRESGDSDSQCRGYGPCLRGDDSGWVAFAWTFGSFPQHCSSRGRGA